MFQHRRRAAHGPIDRPRRRFERAPALAAALLGMLLAVPLLAPAAPAAGAPSTPTATATPKSSATSTATPTPTSTRTPTPTAKPAPTRTATPSPSPTPTPAPVPSPPAPTIDTPAAGSFVGGSTVVSGTRDPAQQVQLFATSGREPLCEVAAGGSATWSCTGVLLPSGPDVQLRAVTGEGGVAAQHSVRVLQSPTVTGGATGASTSGVVRGTGYPGATVTATLAGGQNCSFTVDDSGAWACLLQGGLISGQEQITASQQSDFSAPESSPASAPVALLIDVDAPSAPVVAAPTAGTELSLTGSEYYGGGENGATVTVFAGAYSVCSSVVSGGTWSCSGSGVAAGSYALRAVQQDAAGNVSAGSTATRVRYGAAPAAPRPTATPQPTPRQTAAPTPTASAPATPSPTATAAATAPVTATPSAPSPTPAPSTPAPVEPDDTADASPPELTVPGGWSDPTQFSTAVIPPWTVAQFPWLRVALLTLGALLLLVVPARLLAGTISRARGGRPLLSGHRFAGRNHPREDFEVPPTVNLARSVVGGAAVLAAAVFVLLSGPVTGTPNYLRLLLAVLLALTVVNTVALLVPQWWGSRAMHLDVAVTVPPRYLVLVAVTALASRALELHPALLFGLLGSVVVRSGPLAAQRGQLAAVRAGSLLALGLAGLLVVGTLPTADGFASTLAAEFVNTVVLASIGSAVLVLIPVGSTSGRSILAWSPPVWAALAVPAFLALFVLLSPTLAGASGDGTVALFWLAAAIFAGVSVALWTWQRFVLPVLR